MAGPLRARYTNVLIRLCACACAASHCCPSVGSSLTKVLCAGSDGAKLHADLVREDSDHIVFKGTNSQIDSYSGFMDNDRQNMTEMHTLLQSLGVTKVIVVGLATDYCVGFSAADALALGYETTVVASGCRGIDAAASQAKLDEVEAAGARVVATPADL